MLSLFTPLEWLLILLGTGTAACLIVLLFDRLQRAVRNWWEERDLERRWARLFAKGETSLRYHEWRAFQHPWGLRPEIVRTGFDRIREAIPVDDEELTRARPARPAKPRLS